MTDLVTNILATVAQEEVTRLGMRVSKAWEHLTDCGWYKVGAAVAWGYRSRPATPEELRDGAPKTVIEPDPDVEPYVREVFRKAADGEKTRAIARWTATLPDEICGVMRGKRDRKGKQIREDRPRHMTQYMLQYVLRNPTYVGRMTPDGDRCKWEPIVDEATWHAVQRRLAGNALPQRASGEYLLTGLLHCPACGGRMQGELVSYRHGDGEKHDLPRYRCGNGKRVDRNESAFRCSETADRRRVDALVLETIGSLFERLEDPGIRAELKRRLAMRSQSEDAVKQGAEVRRLTQQVARSTKVINAATRKWSLDEISHDRYDMLVAEETQTLKAATAELEKLRVPEKKAAAMPPPDEILAMVGGWKAALRDARLTTQRDVLAAFISRVVPRRKAPRSREYAADITWTPLGEQLRAICGEL